MVSLRPQVDAQLSSERGILAREEKRQRRVEKSIHHATVGLRQTRVAERSLGPKPTSPPAPSTPNFLGEPERTMHPALYRVYNQTVNTSFFCSPL
jgi:hypothetical protein